MLYIPNIQSVSYYSVDTKYINYLKLQVQI